MAPVAGFEAAISLVYSARNLQGGPEWRCYLPKGQEHQWRMFSHAGKTALRQSSNGAIACKTPPERGRLEISEEIRGTISSFSCSLGGELISQSLVPVELNRSIFRAHSR